MAFTSGRTSHGENSSSRSEGTINATRNPDSYVHESKEIYTEGNIRGTKSYKDAYALFSKLDDKTWLQRLESIADSVVTYSGNVFQEAFNQAEIQNKNSEAISLGVQQIQQLVAEYQEFRNSLPATQAQQFSDANLNPLTQSYSGSNINPSIIPEVAGVPELTPVTDIISTLSSVAINTTSGVISFISTFRELAFKERDNLISMAERGIPVSSKLVSKRNKPFNTLLQGSPFAQTQHNKWSNEQLKSSQDFEFTEDLYNKLFPFLEDTDDNSRGVSDIFKDLANLNFEIFKGDMEMRSASQKSSKSESEFNKELFDNLDGNERASAFNTQNEFFVDRNSYSKQYISNQKQIERKFSDILDKWVEKANQGSLPHMYFLLNLRTQGNTGVGNVVDTLKGIIK